jgi:uncharacterized protein (TIGR04255 family)
MTPSEKYQSFKDISKPPVLEAIIDFALEPISLEELEAQDIGKFTKIFPIKEPINSFEGSFGNGQAHIQQNFLGYMLKSHVRKDVIQIRTNGFSYSVLEPYPSWDQFSKEALKFFEIYLTIRQSSIIRLGLRYINNIKQPTSISHYSEMFSDGLPANASHFGELRHIAFRYVVEAKGFGGTATVQLFQRGDAIGASEYLLDIDVILPISIGVWSAATVNDVLGNLRNTKNDIFFGTLSEKLLDSYR